MVERVETIKHRHGTLGGLGRGGIGGEAASLRAEFGQRGIDIGLRAAGDDDVRSGGDEFFRGGKA